MFPSFLRVCSESTHNSLISNKLSAILLVIIFNYLWLSDLCWHLCQETFGFPLSSQRLVLTAEMGLRGIIHLGLSKDTFTSVAPNNEATLLILANLVQGGQNQCCLFLLPLPQGGPPFPTLLPLGPGDGMGIKRQVTDTEHLAFRQTGRKRGRRGLCFPVPWLSRGNVSMVSRSSENRTEAPASFPASVWNTTHLSLWGRSSCSTVKAHVLCSGVQPLGCHSWGLGVIGSGEAGNGSASLAWLTAINSSYFLAGPLGS